MFSSLAPQISERDHQSQCPQRQRSWCQQTLWAAYPAPMAVQAAQSCHRYRELQPSVSEKRLTWARALIRVRETPFHLTRPSMATQANWQHRCVLLNGTSGQAPPAARRLNGEHHQVSDLHGCKGLQPRWMRTGDPVLQPHQTGAPSPLPTAPALAGLHRGDPKAWFSPFQHLPQTHAGTTCCHPAARLRHTARSGAPTGLDSSARITDTPQRTPLGRQKPLLELPRFYLL